MYAIAIVAENSEVRDRVERYLRGYELKTASSARNLSGEFEKGCMIGISGALVVLSAKLCGSPAIWDQAPAISSQFAEIGVPVVCVAPASVSDHIATMLKWQKWQLYLDSGDLRTMAWAEHCLELLKLMDEEFDKLKESQGWSW